MIRHKTKITQEMIDQYCELMVDISPIHKTGGVVPGMFVTGLIAKGNVTDYVLRNISTKYFKPIFVDEEIEVHKEKVNSKANSLIEEYTIYVNGELCQRTRITLAHNFLESD